MIDGTINNFNLKGFDVINYIYIKNGIIYIVKKDYAKKFNINFNGKIILKVYIDFNFYNGLISCYYPQFKEISNLIPKKADNHIYLNGNICYAPPYRPIYEKWKLIDFINAVDAMINNFFSKEYIGVGFLTELEHDKLGMLQYNRIIDRTK